MVHRVQFIEGSMGLVDGGQGKRTCKSIVLNKVIYLRKLSRNKGQFYFTVLVSDTFYVNCCCSTRKFTSISRKKFEVNIIMCCYISFSWDLLRPKLCVSDFCREKKIIVLVYFNIWCALLFVKLILSYHFLKNKTLH